MGRVEYDFAEDTVRDTGIDIYVPVKESIDTVDHSEEVSKITNNIRKNEMKMKE